MSAGSAVTVYVIEREDGTAYDPEDGYADLESAKARAREIAQRREQNRVRYARGSLEWNLAGGWATPTYLVEYGPRGRRVLVTWAMR